MKKSDLVTAVSGYADISEKKATKAIDGFLKAVSDELADGGSVVLTGFGTFSQKTRKARKGRNPKTGQEIDIPAAKIPHFKAGKTLKTAVNS